jgi:DNA mismatch endonuclease (patch repair protein)
VVFKKEKLAIFIDGDFWHGYNWIKLGIIPSKGFWQEKISRNMAHDKKVNKKSQSWVGE